MADRWITPAPVEALLQTDLSDDPYILELVDHAQSLAELEIGEQATPSRALKAVVAQIVARMWQAGKDAHENPSGANMEVAGPFTTQRTNAGVAGLGLTDREKSLLRQAVKQSGLWVQPTSRGTTLETAPGVAGGFEVLPEQVLDVVGGGEPIVWFGEADLPT